MSVPQILLGLLSERPKHGYELKREHDERLPAARPLAYGQVYSTLQRLERDGLVTVAETVREGGPERVVYAITANGRERVRSWLAEIEPPAPYVSSALFARVVVALVAGDADPKAGPKAGRNDDGEAAEGTAGGYLARQRAAHLERMRELTARKSSPAAPIAEVLAADYAIQHLDADLRWMETTSRRLADLTQEIQK